jgi:hypothetical protein
LIDHSDLALSTALPQPHAVSVDNRACPSTTTISTSINAPAAVVDLVDELIDQMPKGRAHLKDQLDRSATSIVLLPACRTGGSA